MTQQFDSVNVVTLLTEDGERVFSPNNLPTWAQVTNKPTNLVTADSSPSFNNVRVNGGFYDMVRPVTSGGWARGMSMFAADGTTRLAGIGFLGSGSVLGSMHIGFGENWWSDNNGRLSIFPTVLQFNGNEVFHAGNVPTASEVGALPDTYVPAWAEVTGKPAFATRWPTWAEVTGKPTSFTPSSHTHTWAQVTGKPNFATRWPTFDEVSGKPAFATRWPTYAEVTGKPTFITQATADGRYLGINAKPATAGTADNANAVGGIGASSFLRSDASDTFTGTLTATASGNTAKRILRVGNDNSGILRYSGQNSLAFYSDSSCMVFAGDGPDKVLTGLGYYQSASHAEDVIVACDGTLRLFAGQQSGYNASRQATLNASGVFNAPTIQQGGTNLSSLFLAVGGKAADANLLDGLNSNAFSRARGQLSTSGGDWTTAQFISWLNSSGAFNQGHWTMRGSWSYASNRRITDTGQGTIHLAGCAIEVFGTLNNHTIIITTPTTSSGGGTTNAQFTYINNGSSYSPGWRRDYNTRRPPSKSDVGLSNVNNWGASSSTSSTSTSTYATSRAAYDAAAAPRLAADRKRSITISTSAPSGGASGDVWIRY